MAAASYSTDLLDFKTLEAATTLGEMAGYVATGAPALDTDYPIQGTQHASASMTKTGLGSIMADFGSNVSWTSGHSFFMWGVFTAPAAVDTYANGGLRFLLGSDITTNFKGWIVGGNDYGRYPYGGWQNFAVNPETTSDYTGGTLAGYRWAGIGVNCIAAIGKGVPVGLDCIRYGRGQLAVINGDLANGYGTFDAMAAANDSSTARWGLFQNANGSYLWKGLMSLGTTATAVDFRDNNAIIFVDQTPKVLSTFNKIEVNNAASRVDWTGVSVQALGIVSKGSFECVADADVNFTACTFTDMATFIFKPLSNIISSTFRRCGQITAGGGVFTSCTIDNSTAVSAVLATIAHVPNITYTDFISDGTGHAIEITGTATNFTFTGNTFTGYASTNGSTGNEAIFVNIASGTINISISGGGSTPTIRTAGATVTVSNAKTLTLTGLITGSDIVIKPSDSNTAIVNIDQNVGSTYNFSYEYVLGTYIDIKIQLAGYKPVQIYDYLLGSQDSALPIAQEIDRAYQ